MLQVGGVGIPARCSRKLVIDLSTQRSTTRASLHTGTPSSRSACRTPSRMVTCSKLPPGMIRTNAPSGSAPANPGSCRPWRPAEMAKPQSARETWKASARPANARFSRRVCQSGLSTKIAILGRSLIAEGPVDQRLVERAAMEAAATVQGRHDGLCRTEEQAVDGIEIALVAREDLGEPPPVVARSGARQALRPPV